MLIIKYANKKTIKILFLAYIHLGFDLPLRPGIQRRRRGDDFFKKSESYEEDIPYSQVTYHKAPYGFSDVDVVFWLRITGKMKILLAGIINSYDGRTESNLFCIHRK